MDTEEFVEQLCDPDNDLKNNISESLLAMHILLTIYVIVSTWLTKYSSEQVGKVVGVLNYYILTILFSLCFALPFSSSKINGFRIVSLNQNTFH